MASGKSASKPLPKVRWSAMALGNGGRFSVTVACIRSVVGVAYLPAIHRAGFDAAQISVSQVAPLDVTEMMPSSVTNCLTTIPVGFTPLLDELREVTWNIARICSIVMSYNSIFRNDYPQFVQNNLLLIVSSPGHIPSSPGMTRQEARDARQEAGHDETVVRISDKQYNHSKY